MDYPQQFDQKMIANGLNWPEMGHLPYYFNPYYQVIQYCPMQFSESGTENKKSMQEFGVQTEKSYISQPEQVSSIVEDSDEQQSTLKQFPLPNKEKLWELFQSRSAKRKDISVLVANLCSEKSKALNNFYKSIGEKIINFKKTKEEIIKFLVRRAWKKQNQGPGEAREKYYAAYKSMNSEYLSVVFKEPEFVAAYEEVLRNFDAEFDAFNLQRFNRFYDYLLRCYVNNKLAAFKMSKECKSKLPYPLQWKLHIHEIAKNLNESFHLKDSSRKYEVSGSNFQRSQASEKQNSKNSENPSNN